MNKEQIDELQKAKTANSDIYFKKHLYFFNKLYCNKQNIKV